MKTKSFLLRTSAESYNLIAKIPISGIYSIIDNIAYTTSFTFLFRVSNNKKGCFFTVYSEGGTSGEDFSNIHVSEYNLDGESTPYIKYRLTEDFIEIYSESQGWFSSYAELLSNAKNMNILLYDNISFAKSEINNLTDAIVYSKDFETVQHITSVPEGSRATECSIYLIKVGRYITISGSISYDINAGTGIIISNPLPKPITGGIPFLVRGENTGTTTNFFMDSNGCISAYKGINEFVVDKYKFAFSYMAKD